MRQFRVRFRIMMSASLPLAVGFPSPLLPRWVRRLCRPGYSGYVGLPLSLSGGVCRTLWRFTMRRTVRSVTPSCSAASAAVRPCFRTISAAFRVLSRCVMVLRWCSGMSCLHWGRGQSRHDGECWQPRSGVIWPGVPSLGGAPVLTGERGSPRLGPASDSLSVGYLCKSPCSLLCRCLRFRGQSPPPGCRRPPGVWRRPGGGGPAPGGT